MLKEIKQCNIQQEGVACLQQTLPVLTQPIYKIHLLANGQPPMKCSIETLYSDCATKRG